MLKYTKHVKEELLSSVFALRLGGTVSYQDEREQTEQI
jgi:hypothetical protein